MGFGNEQAGEQSGERKTGIERSSVQAIACTDDFDLRSPGRRGLLIETAATHKQM